MDRRHNSETDRLFEAILTLKSAEECYSFFEDVCTIKEIQDLAQRFRVAELLRDGKSYLDINKETGVSTATISRVNRCIEYGSNGYNLAMDRLKEKDAEDK